MMESIKSIFGVKSSFIARIQFSRTRSDLIWILCLLFSVFRRFSRSSSRPENNKRSRGKKSRRRSRPQAQEVRKAPEEWWGKREIRKQIFKKKPEKFSVTNWETIFFRLARRSMLRNKFHLISPSRIDFISSSSRTTFIQFPIRSWIIRRTMCKIVFDRNIYNSMVAVL